MEINPLILHLVILRFANLHETGGVVG